MGIMDRLNRLDDRVGIARVGPREGESRRDYFARVGRQRWLGYENPLVYRELAELNDRVALLESRLAELERRG